ncbi:MAG: hypothetical protein KDA43_08310, partial [Hyphomonas sp.]|nr:hypothetical protein [Hyphomonas sp.]
MLPRPSLPTTNATFPSVSSTTHTRLLALLLTVISLTIFGIKVFKYNYPLAPGAQTTTWDFEIYLDFNTANQPV